MALMDNAPHDFCLHHTDNDLRKLEGFCHRTFCDTDLLYFVEFFKRHYTKKESLEEAFLLSGKKENYAAENALNSFYQYFFSLPDVPKRTMKHIASPAKKSTCKRLNMYLRWMVRNDKHGVDFGLWNNIPMRELMIPLDLHVARVARHFGLIQRKATDWETVKELTAELRVLDPDDPAKYDFALFALGVLEKF